MLTNNLSAAATVVVALAAQASAFNSHRVFHRHADKRAVQTDWVTVWETVVVTAGQEPEPTQKAEAVDAEVVKPAAVTATVNAAAESAAPAPAPEAPAPPPPAPPAPAPEPTTLATAVKEQPAPPSAEPKVEEKPTKAAVVNAAPAPSATKPEPKPQPKPSDSKPSGGSPFSSKRGIAYNEPQLANAFSTGCSSCNWGYNWGSASNGLEKTLSFVPMLWGDKPEFTNDWHGNCESAIASGSKAILSFNEPDMASQSNMDPSSAAAAHAKYFNKYQGQVLIGAPAVSNSGNSGEGLEWLKSFMDACDSQGGCAVDFCPVHWYSEAQYADTLFEHLEKAHEICGNKPVWLTEFAPLGSDDQISSFLKTNIPKLDNVEYLDAYSYFMVSAGSLMSDSSALSGYGQVYATA